LAGKYALIIYKITILFQIPILMSNNQYPAINKRGFPAVEKSLFRDEINL